MSAAWRSATSTRSPRSRRTRTTCPPMSPAPPVTRATASVLFLGDCVIFANCTDRTVQFAERPQDRRSPGRHKQPMEDSMRALREVVIVDAVRTGIGRGHPVKGQYRDVHANELLGTTFRGLLARTGVEPARIDDVIAGCVLQYGEQSINTARNAWLQAGLPETVPATTVDRQCGSGQQAVNFAAALIASGAAEMVVAGGVEHMGHVPFAAEEATREVYGTPWPQPLLDRHELVPQGLAAERLADRWEITRAEMDTISLTSHQRAARAWEAGCFDAE